ncbi:MAG: hypothetical protein EXS17_05015 [Phycisphaerales bacterium]|nr:hypothetical protein [Phycisphaerales bacterium]
MNRFGTTVVSLALGWATLSGCSATVHSGIANGSSSGSLAWAQVLERNPNPAVVTDAALLARIKATGLPWRVRDIASGIEMLLVPPGQFVMGMSLGDMSAMEDERPAHEVVLTKAFYLGRTEVTQDQWTHVMGYNQSYFQEVRFHVASGAEQDEKVAALVAAGFTLNEAELKAGRSALIEVNSGQWPAESLTPVELLPYLCKTELRLPTEAEWEYAARAGAREPRDIELDAIAWYSENAEQRTHAVGEKAPNALGFYDMIGNVWEWVGDWYSADYYAACENGVTDPTGPATSDFRVARGGSWDHVAKNCRVSFRQNHYIPDPRITDFGFRVARNP